MSNMSNLPPHLYFTIRRIGDQIQPRDILHDEMPVKYGAPTELNDVFEKHARFIHQLNPNDYDQNTASMIRAEKELTDNTEKRNNLNVDRETPPTPEEQKNKQRFDNYVNQKNFFTGSRSGRAGTQGGPEYMDDAQLDRLDKMKAEDPELDYFDDIGKHMYVHHGWGLEDFQDHPTSLDRAVAYHLSHSPMLGTVLEGGVTSFEDLDRIVKGGSAYRRIPCLGTPTPSRINEHMMFFHGKLGNQEDHIKEHQDGVSNHTHPSR
jgi:hypothetical protein